MSHANDDRSSNSGRTNFACASTESQEAKAIAVGNNSAASAPTTADHGKATTTATVSTTAASAPKRYSLLTALCMIMGICIGSGIYFKADNVLVATNGSVPLGIAMFCIASITIIFGGLTLSLYAERGDAAGGVVAYARDFLSPLGARLFSWSFSIIYLPSIGAILCWVVGVYACMTFGWGNSFVTQEVVGLIFMLLCIGWNMAWPRFSGWLQNASTLLKVTPLIAVGFLGVAFGDTSVISGSGTTLASQGSSLAWLAAAAPIAFSFDGWSAAASIAPELRNSRRNLPLALTVAPLLILVLYLAYFIGISAFLGSQQVMDAGDESLALVFVQLFGRQAAAIPNAVALISVMGSANGVLLALLRMPQALALKNDIPCSEALLRVSKAGDKNADQAISPACAGVALLFLLASSLLHCFTQLLGLLPNGDVSEIAVAFNMLVLIPLYVRAFGLWRSGKTSVFRGLIAPVLAIACSLFVGGSSLMQPGRWPFVVLYLVILGALYLWHKGSKSQKIDV